MNAFSIVIKNITHRMRTSILSILTVACGTTLVVALLIMSHGLQDGMIDQGSQFDIIVGAQGSPTQLMLSTLFHYEAPIGNIPYEVYLDYKDDPRVTRAIPVALGDSYQGFRIVGSTAEYFQEYDLRQSANQIDWNLGDAVIGSKVAQDTGLTLGDTFQGIHGISNGDDAHAHDYFDFKVVGILESTNTGHDLLIHTPLESVWTVHAEDCDEDHSLDGDDLAHEGAHEHGSDYVHDDEHHDTDDHAHDGEHHHDENAIHADDHHGADDHHHHDDDCNHEDHSHEEVTAILINTSGPVNQIQVVTALNAIDGVQAINTTVVLRQLLNTIGSGIEVAQIIAFAALMLSILTILVALLASMSERRKDAAILRLIGTHKGVVLRLIVLEAMLLTFIGAMIGVAAAHIAGILLGNWVTETTGMFINATTIVPGEITIILLILFLGASAGFFSGMNIYKTQPTTFTE